MIEFDVRLTRDGVLALMHDAKVDRTTNGEGRFADMTLAELRRLDAGVRKDARFAGTRIPTLEETLALMPRNVWLNCHLRTDSAELGTAAARAVEKAGRLHQAFLAARVDAADAARAAVPEVMLCYMGRQGNTDRLHRFQHRQEGGLHPAARQRGNRRRRRSACSSRTGCG